MSDDATIKQCCVEREIATRLQRARAATLIRALEQILRIKSLAKVQELASAALGADRIVTDAMIGIPMPSMHESENPGADR